MQPTVPSSSLLSSVSNSYTIKHKEPFKDGECFEQVVYL